MCFGVIVEEARRRVVDRMYAMCVDDGRGRMLQLQSSMIIKTAGGLNDASDND